MMLPVSVMKVMPTATQPMNEMALSSALMLSGEVKPGVVSANIARPPGDGPDAETMRRRSVPLRRTDRAAATAPPAARASLMPPRPGG